MATLGGAAALGAWQTLFVAKISGLAGISSVSLAAALWCFHNAIATLDRLTQWAGEGPIPLLYGVLSIIATASAPVWLPPAALTAVGILITFAAIALAAHNYLRLWRAYRHTDRGEPIAMLWFHFLLAGFGAILALGLLAAAPAAFVPTANATAVGLIFSVFAIGAADIAVWLLQHAGRASGEAS